MLKPDFMFKDTGGQSGYGWMNRTEAESMCRRLNSGRTPVWGLGGSIMLPERDSYVRSAYTVKA